MIFYIYKVILSHFAEWGFFISLQNASWKYFDITKKLMSLTEETSANSTILLDVKNMVIDIAHNMNILSDMS